jgi:DNA-binding transcriptional LysR family regulator
LQLLGFKKAAAVDAGQRLLERLRPAPKCKQHLILNNFRDRPAGTLRLNVPSSAARLVLPAIVPAFLAAYPDIRLEVIAEESFVDVLAAGCDAGIRCEEILEQGMIAVPKPGGRALPAHSGRCLVPPAATGLPRFH